MASDDTEILAVNSLSNKHKDDIILTSESDKQSDELRGLRLQFEHQYQCNQCGKWFRWAGGRNEHIRIVHEGRQAYKCALCPRAFSTSSGLKRHSVGHKRKQPHSSDERQYQCNQCGKCFQRLSGRKQHIEIVHEGRRPYECVQCPRTFSTTNGLRRHLVAHQNKHPRLSNLNLAEDSSEQANSASALNMMCSDVKEFDTSSVIEMLLDENPVKSEEIVSEIGSTDVDYLHVDSVNNDCSSEHPGQTVLCNTENGIDGCISEQYVCGECGEIFSRELDVKSHMFTKHMYVSREWGSNGVVNVVRIIKPGMTQSAAAEDNTDFPQDAAAAAGDDDTDIEQAPTEEMNSEDVPSITISGSEVAIIENNVEARPTTEVTTDAPVGLPQSGLCQLCGKMFKKLSAHMRRHRTSIVDVSDPDQKTAQSSTFSEHENIHVGDRSLRAQSDGRPCKYQCNQCGKFFQRPSTRNQHFRIVHEGRRAHKCMHCPRAFTTSSELKRHTSRQHKNSQEDVRLPPLVEPMNQPKNLRPESQYQCSLCGKSFRRAGGRNEHVRIVHEGRRAYKCSLCPRTFTTSSERNRHVIGSHKNDPWKEEEGVKSLVGIDPPNSSLCPICGRTFVNLYVHLRRHWEPAYECSVCGRKFASKSSLSSHQVVHSDERPYLCMSCGRAFKTVADLRVHVRTHSEDRPFRCEVCGKSFRRSSGRAEHVRIVHEGRRPFQCVHCSRAFSTSSEHKRHLIKHSTVEPPPELRCRICRKQFENVSALNRHFDTHAGSRSFPCRVRGYRFNDRKAARNHEATQHSADRGRCHECELCGRRFSKKSIRDAHVRRHKGPKPHARSMCDWAGADMSALCQHMIGKHKLKSEGTDTLRDVV